MNTTIFKTELQKLLKQAEMRGAASIEINSGELRRTVGRYPSTRHHMPVCCSVIYAEMRPSDRTNSQPQKGKGASLTIRYAFPR